MRRHASGVRWSFDRRRRLEPASVGVSRGGRADSTNADSHDKRAASNLPLPGLARAEAVAMQDYWREADPPEARRANGALARALRDALRLPATPVPRGGRRAMDVGSMAAPRLPVRHGPA